MSNVFDGKLVCERRGAREAVVDVLRVADRWWSRLAGLQFRRSLLRGEGLLLVPCSSVHTFCMRFPIDAALLDRKGEVLEVRRNVRPWRIVRAARAAHAVLEVPGGSCRLEPGDRLRLDAPGGSAMPRSLAFLCAREAAHAGERDLQGERTVSG